MNFEVNAHDAPLSRLVFLRADGSTGTLDLHDDNALHDEDEVIRAKHLAAHAVTNGKIAPGAVTDNELAGHAVDRRHLSEELDTELANLKKSCDSIAQSTIAYEDVSFNVDMTKDQQSTGQPKLHTLACTKANASNYIGKQLVKAWPTSSWTSPSGEQPIMNMYQVYSAGTTWNRCYFTTNFKQTYGMVVRVFYWDKKVLA